MQENKLGETWLEERSRFQPAHEEFDFSLLSETLNRWLQEKLEALFDRDLLKIFDSDGAGIVSLLLVIFALVLCVIFSIRLYSTLRTRITRTRLLSQSSHYTKLVSQGKLSEAFRYLVACVAKNSGLDSKTFGELFASHDEYHEVADLRDHYGRLLHLNENVQADTLHRCEILANKCYASKLTVKSGKR